AVSLLTRAFELAWRSPLGFGAGKGSRRWAPPPGSPVRLNHTRRLRRQAYRDFLGRILEARRRVWITNPYFVPDLALARALRFVAWSGTEVRLLLPARSDIRALRWVTRSFYPVLLAGGVRIFEYLPSVLH